MMGKKASSNINVEILFDADETSKQTSMPTFRGNDPILGVVNFKAEGIHENVRYNIMLKGGQNARLIYTSGPRLITS